MQACEQMMLRGEAQFLLCHYHPNMSSRLETRQFKSMVVGADTLVPLSAPGRDGTPRWWLHGGEPVRYLAYSAQSGLGRIVATRWEAKDRGFALETVFTSHLAATLLSMARAGDGVAWLPRTLAEEDISAGTAGRSRQSGFGDTYRNSAFSPCRASEPSGRVGMGCV